MAEPSGWVGLDLNEENITAHDSLGNTTVFDIGRIRKAREKYVDKTSSIHMHTTVLAILRYLILEGYEKPGKST